MNEKRYGKPFTCKEYSITPIERLLINSYQNDGLYFHSVIYEPVGIVIEIDSQRWAIAINGQQVSINDLLSIEIDE